MNIDVHILRHEKGWLYIQLDDCWILTGKSTLVTSMAFPTYELDGRL